MEDRLKRLIDGNSEANRTRWAMEWKKQGGKVIGVVSSYVPEEAIWAAGMLPFRLTGTWKDNVENARVYRCLSTGGYGTHVLESILKGELDFLDGIVFADQDQDLLRLWDVILHLKKPSFCHAIHIPFFESEHNNLFLRDEIRRAISSLEDFGGITVTEEALRSSIDTYNQMRSLLSRVYELRKKETPPLSGAEVMGIVTAAQVMPKDEFNRELEALLPYLEERQTNLSLVHPRLLLSSEFLDNPAYIDLIEEGCLVAMDDMDTGSSYFDQTVDTALEDPAYALAKRYLGHHGLPRMLHWDKQVEQILKWINEYNIDGVLNLALMWSHPQLIRRIYLENKLGEAGIPYLFIEREYYLANVGQLRTRIGAFLEMLA
ncbi:2-hydroxyacyl-CoA dehydratase subunit D [Chloroflexota bacterium]